MKRCAVLWLCLILAGGELLTAQPLPYLHRVIGTRDGLNSSKIFALHQDASRQLWVGTEQGVSRYNGYEFENLAYTAASKQVGRVLALCSDKIGGTWIGGDNGLFYFNRQQLRAVPFAGKKGYVIEALVADAGGNIWIGGYEGVHRITAAEVSKFSAGKQHQLSPASKLSFSYRVFGLATDPYQNLYIAGSYGIYLLAKGRNAIELLWKNPNPNNYVRSVAAHSPDSVYWNLYDSAPMYMLDGKLDSLPHKNFTGRNVFIHEQQVYALTTSGIAKIFPGQLVPILSFENISNLVYASLIDREGNAWLGSWEGLIKFRQSAFKTYQLQHPHNTDAFSFLENNAGDVLIGGNRGRIFTLKDDGIIPDKRFPLVFEKAEVMTMLQRADGGYWFGSGYQGISRYQNNWLRNWNGKTDELQNNNCEMLLDAGNGYLFACTEKGVTKIDPAKENAIVGYIPFKENYAVFPELFGGIEVKGSWYFYGSRGLYRIQGEQLWKDSISGVPFESIYINKIVKDKDGKLWIATLGHGLLKCGYDERGFYLLKQFGRQHGLSSNELLSVLVDKNETVWVADYMSLAMIQQKGVEDVVTMFNEADGLLSTYYQSLKLEQQKNGRVWGISSMGLFSFHPDSIRLNALAPLLALDSVLINAGKGGEKSIKDSRQFALLRLDHDANSLRFYFTATSLTDPSKIQYAYRIRSIDSNWIYTKERQARFDLLPPGKHEIEIKAANNNGVWTAEPMRFSFEIVPPFWKTAWFVLIICLLGAAILFLIFRRRMQAVRKRAAIQQQLAELEGKALRAQMNPHFIFNSLNAIQECIVSGNIERAYDYLARFSKLLRMVLNNSERELIPLQDELDMIKIYLELESLRFKDNFSYDIILGEEVDPEMCEVPPLLLQPYIENAIWHGLLHKEGSKHIDVSCREEEGILYCRITDNGIGRKRSAEIKAGKLSAEKFESRGMKLSEQRMQMLNVKRIKKYSLTVTDIMGTVGDVQGTLVELALPQ